MHQMEDRSSYIQMFPFTIPASKPKKGQHKIVNIPLKDLILKYVSLEFAIGLLSPFVIHPTLKKAANNYVVPNYTKKYFTAGKWLLIEEVTYITVLLTLGFDHLTRQKSLLCVIKSYYYLHRLFSGIDILQIGMATF